MPFVAGQLACAGAPIQVSAERFRELRSAPIGSLYHASFVGVSQGAKGRAYLEVWQPRILGPDLVIYSTPLEDFSPSEREHMQSPATSGSRD